MIKLFTSFFIINTKLNDKEKMRWNLSFIQNLAALNAVS